MHPLSVPVYYRRNLNRVGIIVTILALSIVAVLAISALTGSFKREVLTGQRFYTNYYVLSLTGPPSDYQKARDHANEVLSFAPKASLLEGDFLVARKQALTGGYEVPIMFLSAPDRARAMQQLHQEAAEGSLEEGKNDLLFTQSFLDNKAMSVGDSIGDKFDETEFLSGDYRISGSVRTTEEAATHFVGFGDLSYSNSNFGNASSAFFVQPLAGQEDALHTTLRNLKKELKDQYPNLRVFYTTEQSFQNLIDKNFQFMDIMVWSIMSILVVVITISLALFNIIVFMQRASEFGLLLAIGYTRGFILRKTIIESISQIIVAVIIGLGLTWLIFYFFNQTVFNPHGFAPLVVFDRRNLLFALPIPVAVAIFSILTILTRITRLDPISILERRD